MNRFIILRTTVSIPLIKLRGGGSKNIPIHDDHGSSVDFQDTQITNDTLVPTDEYYNEFENIISKVPQLSKLRTKLNQTSVHKNVSGLVIHYIHLHLFHNIVYMFALYVSCTSFSKKESINKFEKSGEKTKHMLNIYQCITLDTLTKSTIPNFVNFH